MSDNVVSDRMELTYYDVSKLIRMKVNKMVGNGILYNQEQALSDAHLAYVKAYKSYDPTKAEFTTHIGYRVQMGILTELKRITQKPRPLTFSELDERGQKEIQTRISVQPVLGNELPLWTEGLSQEAKTIINLAINPPRDILAFLQERATNRINTYKSCIKQYLTYIGWGKEKITEAFLEIEEAIDQ